MNVPDVDLSEQLSPIGFGAMTFGDQVGPDEAERMVRTCLDAGVTHFDTANAYTGGASEELLGKLLRPHRDEVVLATKCGNPHGDPERYRGLSPGAINAALEDSLRRLGTDHVDLYYFHLPDGDTPLEASLVAADELVRSGKVRALGVSNYPTWEMCRQQWIADVRGLVPVRTAQMMYNLLARRIEDEYATFATEFGFATVVFNPLAGGLLTGKHRRDDAVVEGRFSNPRYRERYWKEQLFDAMDRLTEIAEQAGTDVRDLALRWVGSRSLSSSVLIGASSHRQLEENLASLQGPSLTADTMAACDEVWELVRGSAPRYDKTRMTER